jgi:hypothetical protein
MLWIANDLGGRLSPDDWDCSSSYYVGRAILPRWVSAA